MRLEVDGDFVSCDSPKKGTFTDKKSEFFSLINSLGDEYTKKDADLFILQLLIKMKGKSFMNTLREKTPKELVAMRKKLKDELFTLKMKNAIRGLKETHKLGGLKIQIARINTVLHSKLAN